jgi:hypothetical protein
MNKFSIICMIGFLSITLASCKKPAGEGGNSTIKGNLWVEDWDKNFVAINYQFAGADEDVYIVYGDDASYGDKVKSGSDGVFEFKYLRPGKYKVYAYSDEKQTSSSPSPSVAKIVEVEITGKKQTVDAGKITIKR